MRYPQSLQEKVIKESLTKTTFEVSRKYNIPEHIIKRWLFLDMPEEQLKVRVRQKFYNLIPLVEGKISGYLSDKDLIVCGVSDDEWEETCKYINHVIFDTIFAVYKSAQLEKVCKKQDLTNDGKHLSKNFKPKKTTKQNDYFIAKSPYLPFGDKRINL